jgi:4'-phosphopantetheinyl transferase
VYAGTRAALRLLLSRYTGIPARDIVLTYGALGKPAYPEGGLHFSISHAGDRALLAFSRSAPVGVDVERVKLQRRFNALVRRFFSPSNAERILSAPVAVQPALFAEAWALREAHVKAVGGGLYATPDVLPFTPGTAPMQRVRTAEAGDWSVAAIPAGTGYAAKLVQPGTLSRLSLYLFE